MRVASGGTVRRPAVGRGFDGARRTVRRRPVAVLLVLAAALSGCGGGEDDPRRAVADTAGEMLSAIREDPGSVDTRVLCNRLDPGTRRTVERLGRETIDPDAWTQCPEVLSAARWRVRPLAALGTSTTVALEQVTVTGDEALVRPAAAGAPLRFRRVGDEWRVDLRTEPRWRFRLERTRACAAAGRRFARQSLPGGGSSSAVAYLRQQVAILRRFEADVAAHRAPAELRTADARLVRALRSARKRAADTVRRVQGDPVAASAAVGTIANGDWDPASQVPGPVSRRMYALTAGCMNASTVATNPATAATRVRRQCAVAVRRVMAFDGIRSVADYRRATTRFGAALEALGRAVGRTTPPPLIAGVHRQTVSALSRMARGGRELVGTVEAGDLAGLEAAARRLVPAGAAIDRGLAQLGFSCRIPEVLPKAPASPA